MGLRLALGAAAGDVVRLVMRPPAVLALTGSIAGLLAALALTRFLEGLLFGVEPSDPRVLAAATASLLVVAALAAWIPARRAVRVDPAKSLRAD
jgi:ABC-type lipoprotein release transport system permease subunit